MDKKLAFIDNICMTHPYKIPVSALILIHTPDLQVLLLERADKAGFWQSVTGSIEAGETPYDATHRVVRTCHVGAVTW